MSRIGKIVTAIGGSLLLVFFAIFMLGGASSIGNAAGPTPDESASADNSCWKVVYDPNDPNGNVDVKGVTGTPDEVRAKYMAFAKTEPAALTALWNMSPPGVKAPIADPATLVDSSGCMTKDAKVKWWTLSIAINEAKVEQSEAPADGCNSLVVNNKVKVKCGAIGGDRTSTKITWTDGSVTHVMHRCKNPVTPRHGGPTPTPTPSGSTCPNGKPLLPNGLCLKDGSKVPAAPALPSASAPNPNGTAASPTRPASPDPSPTNGNPVHDVNPPSASENPDSGSGATNTVPPSNVPTAPSPPAPAPPNPTSSGIVTG
jgi:hypothetical protein